MTWPTVAVDTTDTDAGSDNPATARADLLDGLQKLNQIIAHVSAFVATALDDADATAFRATIGAAAAGVLTATSGTRMLFQQTAAPTGWTKETNSTYNDAALRLVTGTVTTGGADGFTTHFGTSKTTATDGSGTSGATSPGATDSHTLTLADIPSHQHQQQVSVTSSDAPIAALRPTSPTGGGAGVGQALLHSQINDAGPDLLLYTLNIGSGGGHVHTHSATHTHTTPSHAHTLNSFNIKYADHIIAQKD
jgi:hypothetical protein